MNIFISILILCSMFGWAAPPRKVKRASLGKEFIIKVGEQVFIKETGLTVSFVSVAEDSRCPKGVECIWAGNGKIKVKIKSKGKSADLELNTGLDPQQQRFSGYEIKLVNLNPYPEHNVTIERGSYTATLVVSK